MHIIDSHQHFWKYDANRHQWIGDDMAVIRRDFLPKDLIVECRKNGLDGCVSIQVDQTEVETMFLLEHASQNDYIKGVVGWVDLLSSQVGARLAHLSQYKLLKGFRHILQSQKPDFMLQPDFIRGISHLQQYNFTFDLLIKPHHLEAANMLVGKFPEQKFVICHMAKPLIKSGRIAQWKRDINLMAKHDNVFCKISGMVTEANYDLWKKEDFKPYIDVALEAFGIGRVMFGSDWPVCLSAATYDQVIGIISTYFQKFTSDEKNKVFSSNALNFYNL